MSLSMTSIGTSSSIPDVLARVWTYRWQIMVDVRKELAAQSSETFLRWAWTIIIPIVPLTVYLLLALLRVFPQHGEISGVVYVTLGAIIWYALTGLMTAPMTAVRYKGKDAIQAAYPLLAVIIASWGLQLVDTLIRLIFVITILIAFQLPSLKGILIFLPALLLPMLFCAGIGLILALFAVAIHDLHKLVPIVLQHAFFLSLVLFPLPDITAINVMLALNPLAVFVDNLRSLLMLGSLSRPISFIAWSSVSAVVFLWALRFHAAAERRVAGYL